MRSCAGGAPSLHTPAATLRLVDTALRSGFLIWTALRLARSAMIQGLLPTLPGLLDTVSSGERARVDELRAHILPLSPRRHGLLNKSAAIASTPLAGVAPTVNRLRQRLTK